jgi:hypothetical protein
MATGLSATLKPNGTIGSFTFDFLYQTSASGGQQFPTTLTFTFLNASENQLIGFGVHVCVLADKVVPAQDLRPPVRCFTICPRPFSPTDPASAIFSLFIRPVSAKEISIYEHRILSGETDAFSSVPMLPSKIEVRCDGRM